MIRKAGFGGYREPGGLIVALHLNDTSRRSCNTSIDKAEKSALVQVAA